MGINLPPAIQKIFEEHTMHDYDFFAMLNTLDWSKKEMTNLW